MNDQIAVICSVFNSAFLKQMVDSVFYQDYSNFLLILRVDGPSKEEELKIRKILKSYSDPRLKIEYGENMGVDLSRRKILDKLEAPFFLVIDDDDYLAVNCLKELYKRIKDKPWIGIVQGGQEVIGELNKKLLPVKRRNKYGFTLDLLSANQPYLVRKEIYNKTAGWQTDKYLYNSGAETYLFLDMEQKSKIAYVNKILYFRRLHNLNHSLNFNFSDQAGRHVVALINYQIEKRRLKLKLKDIKSIKSRKSSFEKLIFYFQQDSQKIFKAETKIFNFNQRIENDKNIIFSVQCPAYHLEHLEQMIQSVLAQTYKNWELLLCFDNPPQKQLMRKIIKKYGNNKKIKLFINKKNQGPGPVRAFLSRQTRARYIVPIDSDDYISPDLLQEFKNEILKRDSFSIIRAGMKVITEVMTTKVLPEPRIIVDGLTIDIFNVHQPYLIDNFLLKKVGGWQWDKKYHNSGEDTDLFLRLETLAPIKIIPKILYFKRQNPAGITQRRGGPAHLQRMVLNSIKLRKIIGIKEIATELQQIDDQTVEASMLWRVGNEYKIFYSRLSYFIYFLDKKGLKRFGQIATKKIIDIFGHDDISWRQACLYPCLSMPVQVIKPNIGKLLPVLEMNYERKHKFLKLLKEVVIFPEDYIFSIDIYVYYDGLNRQNLRRTIYSLYKNTFYPFRLFLIVNSNTSDRIKRYFNLLVKFIKNIQLINNDRQVNYLDNINLFLQKASAKYVSVVNSGVLLSKNWLSKMIKGYLFNYNSKNIIMISPRVIALDMNNNYRAETAEINRINQNITDNGDVFYEEGILFHDCILVEREKYKEFTAGLQNYNNLSIYADLDISLRLFQKNKKILISKSTVVAKKNIFAEKGKNEEIFNLLKNNFYNFKRNWENKDIYRKLPRALILE